MTFSDSELVLALQEAARDLLWMSESEAPFEVVLWKDQTFDTFTDRTLLQLTHHTEETPVEIVDFARFFEYPTQMQDWHGDEEAAIVHRYQHLVDTLKTHLSDLKVYRVGEIELDVYIMGQTQSGHLAGLATKAVET